MTECTTTVQMDGRGRLVVPQPVRETLGIDDDEYTTVEITVQEVDHE